MVNKDLWLLFFIIKIIYLFLAMYVVPTFTSLGDTFNYLSYSPFENISLNSTGLMHLVAGTSSLFLGDILTNVLFLILTIFGIYYPVKQLNLNRKVLFFLMVLLSMPSFSIWTSVASKESVTVFFMGILLAYLIKYIKGLTSGNYSLLILAIFLCLLFKPQYFLSFIMVFIFVFISKKMKLKGKGKFVLLSLCFLIIFSSFYVFKEQINTLSFIMPSHFSLDAGSTRENNIWVEEYDVFWNAPKGMIIAFIGPTFSEATSNPIQFIVWLESILFLLIFFSFCLVLFLFSVKNKTLNIYYVGIFILIVFLILFVHYPFGVLNAGSAIRYKQGFFSFLVVLSFFVYKEILISHKRLPKGGI